MARAVENRPQVSSLRRRVFSIPTLLSFGIAAAFIFFLATRFDLDWGETLLNIRSMNPWLYGLAALLYYLSFLFRGARWRILAANAAARQGDPVSIPSVQATARLIVVGWFVNSVTWLRLGDAYRAYAFAEESRSSFSWSLGTVLAERVLDMIIVAVMTVIGVALLTAMSGLTVARFIVVIAVVMVLAVTALVVMMVRFGPRLARLLPGRIEEAYRRFHQGALGSFRQLPIVTSLGVIGWLLEMGRLYLVLQALGLDIGVVLTAVVALGHAILSTVPTPGGIGAVEPGVTGLLLMRLSQPDAAAAAILDRSITYVSIVVVGGSLFLLRQVSRMRQSRKMVDGTTRLDRAAE